MFASRSNSNPAEGFTVSLQGTVSEFVTAQLASPALALHYANDAALEIEYSPNGVDSGLCVGISALTPGNNAPVSLQPCGVSARTIWVTDVQNIQRGGLLHVPVPPADQRCGHRLLAPVRADLPAER